MPLPRVLKPSLAYAAMVFGVGFALGAIRVTLVVPRIGMRWAELLEMPFMLVALAWLLLVGVQPRSDRH